MNLTLLICISVKVRVKFYQKRLWPWCVHDRNWEALFPQGSIHSFRRRKCVTRLLEVSKCHYFGISLIIFQRNSISAGATLDLDYYSAQSCISHPPCPHAGGPSTGGPKFSPVAPFSVGLDPPNKTSTPHIEVWNTRNQWSFYQSVFCSVL